MYCTVCTRGVDACIPELSAKGEPRTRKEDIDEPYHAAHEQEHRARHYQDEGHERSVQRQELAVPHLTEATTESVRAQLVVVPLNKHANTRDHS